jgi:hypothetical protein
LEETKPPKGQGLSKNHGSVNEIILEEMKPQQGKGLEHNHKNKASTSCSIFVFTYQTKLTTSAPRLKDNLLEGGAHIHAQTNIKRSKVERKPT